MGRTLGIPNNAKVMSQSDKRLVKQLDRLVIYAVYRHSEYAEPYIAAYYTDYWEAEVHRQNAYRAEVNADSRQQAVMDAAGQCIRYVGREDRWKVERIEVKKRFTDLYGDKV